MRKNGDFTVNNTWGTHTWPAVAKKGPTFVRIVS